MPPKRDEAALQEEEELQLAIALSQSEAEEKERMVSFTAETFHHTWIYCMLMEMQITVHNLLLCFFVLFSVLLKF